MIDTHTFQMVGTLTLFYNTEQSLLQ